MNTSSEVINWVMIFYAGVALILWGVEMTEQPHALRLADILENKIPRITLACLEVSATELRRLYEVNQELLAALKGLIYLEEGDLRGYDDIDISYELQTAYAALAKATGGLK